MKSGKLEKLKSTTNSKKGRIQSVWEREKDKINFYRTVNKPSNIVIDY